ncbi:MAG TPA: glycoside hydrolase family 3 protein [Terriglobales bacterium]|nr:glycoside hydrolase family 3 protein [Terriglobales bacterium]
MKKIFFKVPALAFMVLLAACGLLGPAPENPPSDGQDTPPPEDTQPPPVSKAQERLNGMTLEEKVGQLFIVRPESLLTPDANRAGVTALDAHMAAYPVGGIALFGQNIVTPEQLTSFIDEVQRQSETPLFIAVDEEGGAVARIANSKNFSVPERYRSMQEIGATGEPAEAKKVGATIGAYLKQYGFNLDFAPVADVFTNPNNTVIGNRSFGSDPDLVSGMVAAEISGLHEAGVMSCAKHYPGHGDTKGDTHEGFVSIEKTWDELTRCELIPFMKAIEAQTDMVMVSHIVATNITGDSLPSSLSYEMVEEKLRGELGYTGVVITDAMEMGAISQEYSSSESAVKAILAGVDVILMPENFAEAYEGVLRAVKDGTISEKRIDESVLRILELKDKYGLLEKATGEE